MFITLKRHQQILKQELNSQEEKLETKRLQDIQRLEEVLNDLREHNKDLMDRLAARDWAEYKNAAMGLKVDEAEERELDSPWSEPEDAPPEEVLESLQPKNQLQ